MSCSKGWIIRLENFQQTFDVEFVFIWNFFHYNLTHCLKLNIGLLKLLRCSHLLYTSTGIIWFLLFEIFIDANIGPAITLFIVEGEHSINFAKLKMDGMVFSAVDCHAIIDWEQIIKRQGASWFEMPLEMLNHQLIIQLFEQFQNLHCDLRFFPIHSLMREDQDAK